ncbi:HepT-like ribonuclease domain-containing protein [Chitinophaga caeni]|uniref:HepT-like ribonuclease domain-containing protein n=1 Tax=Chitinophaga caeni TaxID=2029983 RepID=UPI003742D89D
MDKIQTWLYDILNAIIEIESFIEDTERSFGRYQDDLRTRRAVERNIEIIGEALSKILKLNSNIAISNSR